MKLVSRNPLAVKNRYFSLLASSRKQNNGITGATTSMSYNPYLHNNGSDSGDITTQSQSPRTTTFDSARTDSSDTTSTSTHNDTFPPAITDIITSIACPDSISKRSTSKRKRISTVQGTWQVHHHGYLFPDVLHSHNNNQYNYPHHRQLQVPQYHSQSIGFQVITPNTATAAGNNNNNYTGSLSSPFVHEIVGKAANKDEDDDNDLINWDELSILTDDKRDGVVIDTNTGTTSLHSQQQAQQFNQPSHTVATTNTLHLVQDENQNNSNYNQIMVPLATITDVLSPSIIKPQMVDTACTTIGTTTPPPPTTATTQVLLKPVPGHPYLFYDVNHPMIQKIQQSLYC